MTKQLYLIRHAKSSWKNPNLPDFERPLNKRGERDAPLMGERLYKQKIKPDLIISSPAKRAVRTAQIIADKISYPLENIVKDERIYEAGTTRLFEIIKEIDHQIQLLFLVGHNPGLTLLAKALTRFPYENIPTCGIVSISFETKGWSEITYGTGMIKFFDIPKKHRLK